jgi:geranylgeranyl pyrophosphate synthase
MRADLDRVNARVAQAAEVSYPVVADLLSDIVQAGGKRLRPLLLLLAGRAYDYEANFDRLVTAAAGVELLHTASLIHDDTVDRSALRRGKPTLNSMLSSGAVILIGDYLFAQSAMLAAATDSTRVVSVFASTLGDICDGQLMEIFDAQRLDQTREEYERRIYGKTASLFAGSAEMGAILGHAPESHIAALRRYGADLGTAFQIVDDILDVTGATGELGKPAGNDLRQGTVTLPTIFYLAGQSNTSAQWQEIEAIVGGHAADNGAVDDAIRSIRSSGAIDKAVAVAEEYVDRAKETAALVPDDETRDLLAELADLAVHRVS